MQVSVRVRMRARLVNGGVCRERWWETEAEVLLWIDYLHCHGWAVI